MVVPAFMSHRDEAVSGQGVGSLEAGGEGAFPAGDEGGHPGGGGGEIGARFEILGGTEGVIATSYEEALVGKEPVCQVFRDEVVE